MKDIQTLSTNSFRYKPIDGYLSEYYNKVNVNYNYSLAGNSISTTVYKIADKDTTYSEGSGTVKQLIGPESPIRFERIEAFPVFNVSQVDIPLEWTEESGYVSEPRLECIVSPSNMSLDIDDYIVLEYSSFQKLWRVIEANPSAFEEVRYTKVTLVPTPYTKENIEFQVIKRYKYIYETAAAIDKIANDNLNTLLSKVNNYYSTTFLTEFYAEQGIIIRYEELNSYRTKYFKFKQVSNDVKLYSYFFKRFISTTLISSHIQHKELVDRFFKISNPDDGVKLFREDEAKFLYLFIKEIEKAIPFGTALKNTFKLMKKLREKNLLSDPELVVWQFSSPYTDFFDFDKGYYTLLSDTALLIEKTDILVDNSSKDVVKIFSNLNKLLKSILSPDTNDNLLKALLYFSLIKAIPFKSIDFGIRKLEYGE